MRLMLPPADPLSLALLMVVYFGAMGFSGFFLLKRWPGLQPALYTLLALGESAPPFLGCGGSNVHAIFG